MGVALARAESVEDALATAIAAASSITIRYDREGEAFAAVRR
jgi:formate-dependent phosphoribosylglycinamide formyltransferase (GAR transformylase)